MEIQKLTTAQGSSLGLTVNEAIKHPLKINKAIDQDLINALGYCFAVLGFKEENYPVGLPRAFLMQFIRDNYKFYSVEEIKTAFLMLVKGEYLDKSPKHYNNFSPEYFGSVMVCYKSHREKAQLFLSLASNSKQIEKPYEPNTIEKIKIQQDFDKTVTSFIFDKYKQYGILDLGTTPAKLIYNSLIGFHKIMEFTNDEKKAIKQQANKAIEQQLSDLKEGRVSSYADHKKKIELIGNLVKDEFVEDQVITECHKICIKQCFDEMIKNNFKF
jgi:hypothetical protein